MAIKSFSPKLPLDTDNNSRFVMNTLNLENVKQKLKMIILTNPGEKIMDPEFGVGIKKYLFEPISGVITEEGNKKYSINDFKASIFKKLNYQVYKYSPDITIDNIEAEIDNNLLKLTIFYSYLGFTSDSLTIDINF